MINLATILLSIFFFPFTQEKNNNTLIINNPMESTNSLSESPLAKYDAEWNKEKYKVYNTATDANYLSDAEKEIIYILNLARAYPQLFEKTVINKYPEKTGKNNLKQNSYYLSLVKTMKTMQPVGMLQPDSLSYISAYTHAVASGKTGYTGHDRQDAESKSKARFRGECCAYGSTDPLDTIMLLLIDDGIPSLGHRIILLGPKYTSAGVSIQPHSTYRWNTVIDLYYDF